ncbi:uncharacterized protein LOC105421366 [Amborella trichopoda]|uniref:uncharacterized protein LOC105421366 n=1 Tax=Amborella trichopoda TaxID=13333 RepID=UPI0005D37A15|nr:uncharacterized protein LOC105421366 [Amborella trichopoda]|eukprot:XP_011626823.1 uncharacterized protein LOC105421366 [Amborella trichopoda]
MVKENCFTQVERNLRGFQDKLTRREQLVKHIISHSFPSPNHFKINIDGVSLHNPGQAGGGVIKKFDSAVIAVFAKPFGIACNNYVEFYTLEERLILAYQLQYHPIQIESDLALLINVIHERFRPPWKLLIVAVNCRQRLSKCGWSIFHIFREANMAADILAKRATSYQGATV